MVKGISRQVIVVHAPEPKLFEQAIFILNDDAVASGIKLSRPFMAPSGKGKGGICICMVRSGPPAVRC